ncbi:PepSY-associated TM helix domain-containing protein [Maribacter polysaccharolyticus]|uniref:PepSY-associated TM helix domain-containing protein n=1 Tax=Maribacter polysaccharolyticus TaxID=3020831 RepID=UPI00237FCC0A|nr:PepSY-associated TM helix domain-containing protein [Maribacter polysaccharolyticus]MDE3741899.1 PepSY-associated TM helix domain-containing protein [Maribacter polysaccharolyticus]
MTKPNKRIKQAQTLRIFRKIHRLTGAALFIFFFFVSITALLLGWKKHSNGVLLPETYVGSSTDLKQWLPLDSLHIKAIAVLHDSVSPSLSTKLDRIDVRKGKGTVKFVFDEHFWGIQLDGATGEVLHVDKRYSDVIENIHDGSILDKYFNTSDGQIKVVYTSIMAIALLIFTITGFWLWYGPKRMRKSKVRR